MPRVGGWMGAHLWIVLAIDGLTGEMRSRSLNGASPLMRRSSLLCLCFTRSGSVITAAAAAAAAAAVAALSSRSLSPATGTVSTGSEESSNEPRACEKPLVLETDKGFDGFDGGEAKCWASEARATGRERLVVGLSDDEGLAGDFASSPWPSQAITFALITGDMLRLLIAAPHEQRGEESSHLVRGGPPLSRTSPLVFGA